MLNIPDFRHMTKDKIVSFASMLPKMDPEVAKKALEQFPTFRELAGEMVAQYKDVVNRVFEEDRISQAEFYKICNRILDALTKELENEQLGADEKNRIEDKMIEVAKMVAEHDLAHKEWMKKILDGFKALAGVAILGGLGFLGLRINQGHNANMIDMDEEEEEKCA